MIIEKGGNYENPKSGAYIGIVADVAELYNVLGKFGPRNKVRIIWILDSKDSTGKPYRVMEQVNASINERARLYEIAKSVLGAPPTAGKFDTESLLGKVNQLFVVVERGEDGKDYAHVKGILPVPAGAVGPTVPTDFVRAKDKKPFVPAQSNGNTGAAQANPAPQANPVQQATATAVGPVSTPAPVSNVTF
jgi:hypothetical protein